MLGLIGKKVGMTRIFTEAGDSIPVSVIEVQPNKITQIKTVENDGYQAVQITTGSRRANRVTKAAAGHFAKANTEAGRGLWEFRINDEELSKLELGAALTVEMFAETKMVDVTGTSKGKGFQGGVKRHNFRTQDATHGNSLSHRVLGSTGQNQTPGRVFKGKKMAGHMGHRRSTTQNLDIVKVDTERNLLLIKGSVPGSIGGDLIITSATKQSA
jgi:large subunit ribosomal protein L3